MITGIDHVVVAMRELDAGVAAYEALLDRTVVQRSEHDGVATALIALENVALELMAPVGPGGERLRAALDAGGEGLKSLVFAVDDIVRMHSRAERVALAPEPIQQQESWKSFRADTARTHGLRIFFLERDTPFAPSEAGGVEALDHVVIRSADMERAAALYGARLGLDLRLDREVAGRRLMFFRCGAAVIEIAHDPGAARDALWGLSWRVADAEVAHLRLGRAGFSVSDLRPGHKPGTRVFSVREGTCGIPTLMLEASSRGD